MKDKSSSILIRKGSCRALYAYDIGTSLTLSKCVERVSLLGGRTTSSVRNRRAPKYFGYDPQPLTVIQDSEVQPIGPFNVLPAISLTFYDFGAISICYEIALSGSLADVRKLSIEIERNNALLADSRRRALEITAALGDAVQHATVSAPVEDYLIFEINDFDLPCPAEELCKHAGSAIAQVLRGEEGDLSDSETQDALFHRLSYGQNDIAIIDWNSALVFDKDADDIVAVLEFANTELLELRYLDAQLDSSLDASYELAAQPRGILRMLPGWTARNIRRISRMQLEGAILFERVSNAPKLLGDQFLARIYRLASQRFHVGEWNSSILRKLDTIEDFYKVVHDNSATYRLEALEWIIIALIAIEIVLPFIPRLFQLLR
jgi:hypothetical protein